LEEFYKEKCVPIKSMIVSHDAVRVEDFQFDFNKNDLRRELNIPNDKPIVMYTGHLYDWKGADLLAESSKILPEYNFIFVGGTELDIKNFKEKYTNENILFLGFKENKIIPKYLKTADLLVIPNTDKNDVSSKFTSPLKFFEYLASGVPILASDITSLKNIGKDYVAYFKVGNVDDLAEKIKWCIEGGCNNLPKPLYLHSWNQRAKDIIEKK
jgi:glycosyltransferase involved in cell wall biosynthesis